MTTPSKADVLKVAHECGFAGAGTNVFGITDKLERFAAAMYAAGAKGMRERAEPEGWQLVPIEPTDKMLEALYRASGYHPRTVYRDLLAALPIATEQAPCDPPTNTTGDQT